MCQLELPLRHGAGSPNVGAGCMVSHIHAFVRVRPLLPREFAQSTSEAVSVYEVLVNCAVSQYSFRRQSRGGNYEMQPLPLP